MSFSFAVLYSSSLWVRTSTSTTLHAAPSATFTLYLEDGTTPATIYSDRNFTTVNSTGSVTTDSNGNWSCYLDRTNNYRIKYLGVLYPAFDPDPGSDELQSELANHSAQTSGVHGAAANDPLMTSSQVTAAIVAAATPGAATPDATSSVKGKLQLGGDLAGTGGTAAAPKISDALRSQITSALPASQVGLANGAASLDSGGKVPTSQLPSTGTTPDATTSTKGIVQLGGDIAGTSGTAAAPKISDTLRGQITGAEQTANKGVANGYAGLDAGGLVPTAQLPAGGFSGDFGGATATNYKSPPIAKSATFTPVLTESGRFYSCNTGTTTGWAVTLPNTALPGTFWIFQTGSSAPLSFTAPSGGYLVQKDSQFRMTAQNSIVTAYCLSGTGANAGFILWGDTAA